VNLRAAALFATLDDHTEEGFLAEIDTLVADLPADHPDALFHRGCAQDSWGHSDRAVPLYRQALANGLAGEHRRRAVIQMSSSLRNVGEVETALELLLAERENGSDHLDDAVICTIALCLASLGREREGLSVAIVALARHLPRYNRSMTNYGKALLAD
jgi:hypothetical protein